MILFSHWLFWLKNWCFSTNSSKSFYVSLSNTNEGMDGVCSNLADTSSSKFFRQEEQNKEVDKGEGESEKTSIKMYEEDDNDTLENWE